MRQNKGTPQGDFRNTKRCEKEAEIRNQKLIFLLRATGIFYAAL
jgi:hypothetical protein